MAISQLKYAISVDHHWVGEHTRFLVDAILWEKQGFDHASLLRGRALLESEAWLGLPIPNIQLAVTDLQIKYIQTSRKYEDIRKADTLVAQGNAIVLQRGIRQLGNKFEMAKNIYAINGLNTLTADIGLWQHYKQSPTFFLLPLLSQGRRLNACIGNKICYISL